MEQTIKIGKLDQIIVEKVESEVPGGIDTSDATAVPSDILPNKTAYVNGEKITGTMATQVGTTITPSTELQIGIYSNTFALGNISVAGDSNLKAANIKKGVSIFGVTGTYNPSTVVYSSSQPSSPATGTIWLQPI